VCFDAQTQAFAAPHRRHPSCWTSKTLAQLFVKKLPRLCEVQAGELEQEGTAVEYLGRTKILTKDVIITVPDERHYKAVISAAGISAKNRSEVFPNNSTSWRLSHWTKRNAKSTGAQ
jgi:hypothetical protein